MFHKKIAYSFMVALLLLSVEVKSSANDQGKSLDVLVAHWKKLEYEQSLKGRTENVLRPVAKQCGIISCWSLFSGATLYTLIPGGAYKHNEGATMFATIFNLGFTLGYSGKTLKKGCCDKPAQAKREQEELMDIIQGSYSPEQINKAFESFRNNAKRASSKME